MTTLVQIKRSSANSIPGALQAGELAYSYVSNVIFIGDTAGGVMNIGGKFYTDLVDNATAANGASNFVRRYANGSAQFSQLDILVTPTANTHVATKEYVDTAVTANVTLASLNDVDIGTAFSDQNNKILIGNTAGYYVGTAVSGNVSLSNTGVFTIGAGQVTNSMLVNSNVTVSAGAGLIGGGVVDLGNSITIDVAAGDGISNTSDVVAVDNTVVRTDRQQTLNGASYTFSNTVYFSKDVEITGNLFVLGNTTTINTETLVVEDSLIKLASNNDADILDIGFFGVYNSNTYAGLYRDASDNKFKLFTDYAGADPTGNVLGATARATLEANLDALLVNTSTANISTRLDANQINVATTLDVSGNTTLANLSVNGSATVSQNLTVTEFSKANSFISTRTALSPPSITGFDGERLRLYDFNQTGHPNYAIGVEPNNIWFGVDDSANTVGFKWYGNTAQAMRLSGNGVLEVANTIISANLVLSDSANITGTLNVSSATWLSSLTLGSPLPTGSGGTGLSSFTANGVFIADTTSTVSFATGTEGQVLQIASGVPAFAMLDGGSF